MITDSHIIRILFSDAELDFLKRMADKACIGGASTVRSQPADRTERLLEDNLVGQCATYAGHRYLFGTPHMYRISRFYANLYPTRGDGGYDIPGAAIDFKASCIRNRDLGFLNYHLPVRPHERHKGWTYICALIDLENKCAYLLGWATDEMLPAQPDSDGVFKGAFTLSARDLNPLMPIHWQLG